jgi:hypothetical protein
MKTKLSVLLALCALLFGTGCTTTPTTPPTPEQHAQELAGVANIAAWVATVEHLKQKPKDRSYFVAAEAALAQLLNDTNATPAGLAEALSKLPLKELRGPYGAVIVGAGATGVTIIKGIARNPIEQNAFLRKYIEAIRDGIKSGLNQSSPAGARGVYGPQFLFVAGTDTFESTNIYPWTLPDDPRRKLYTTNQ